MSMESRPRPSRYSGASGSICPAGTSRLSAETTSSAISFTRFGSAAWPSAGTFSGELGIALRPFRDGAVQSEKATEIIACGFAISGLERLAPQHEHVSRAGARARPLEREPRIGALERLAVVA